MLILIGLLFIISCAPASTVDLLGEEDRALAGQAISLGCTNRVVTSCTANADGSISITDRGRTTTFNDKCSRSMAYDYNCITQGKYANRMYQTCRTQCESAEDCVNAQCVSRCGNGVLDAGENCGSCTADVICAEGQVCQEGACVTESSLFPAPFQTPVQESVAFDCINNRYNIFYNASYECIDLSDSDVLNKIEQAHTERVVFFGAYSAYDCPNENLLDYTLRNCYNVAWFFDRFEHPFIADYLGVLPRLNFNNTQNPYNIIYVTVARNVEEVHRICDNPTADACAGGWRIVQQASSAGGIDSANKIKTIGINIPETGDSYFYSIYFPNNCHVGEVHEHIHIFDRFYLPDHQSWFEEMLARAIHKTFEPGLCHFNITDTRLQSSNGRITPLNTVDIREINADRPLDNFATFYVGNDTCKQAIIMQLNRESLHYGEKYIKQLFSTLKSHPLWTTDEVGSAIVSASMDSESARTFLRTNLCNIS